LFRPTAGAFFNAAKRLHPELSKLDSPASLFEWLLDFSANSTEDEDAVLRVIRSLTIEPESRPFWVATLALGLWPALTWAFCKIRPARESDYEAADEIYVAFERGLTDESLWLEPRVIKRLMSRLWCRAARQIKSEKSESIKFQEYFESIPQADIHSPFLCLVDKKLDEPAVDDEQKRLICKLVDKLEFSELDAIIVVRHSLAGLTHAEIAEELKLSAASVRQRYSRAIKKVQKKSKNTVTLLVLNELCTQGDDIEVANDRYGSGRPH